MTEPLDLEGLLTRAMAKQTPKKERRKPDTLITPKELAQAEKRLRERFSLPENWEQVDTVALIHAETETLLGNFAVFQHRLSTARKFKRVDCPTVVQRFERVTGDHWLNPPAAPVKIEGVSAEEEREAIIDLHLPEFDHVFAPKVLVLVKLLWGGIARVELLDETRFFSKDKRVHLILPEGLDVLEGMSLDCKLELRKFLGL